MDSFIREIFLSGNLGLDAIKLPDSREYRAINKKENALYEKLKAALSPELFAVLDDFINALLDRHALESEQYYTAGFKTGLRIAEETFNLSDVFDT